SAVTAGGAGRTPRSGARRAGLRRRTESDRVPRSGAGEGGAAGIAGGGRARQRVSARTAATASRGADGAVPVRAVGPHGILGGGDRAPAGADSERAPRL